MIDLACPVRGCGRPLRPVSAPPETADTRSEGPAPADSPAPDAASSASVLRCPAGHAFDRAREGYWNLLQPQDRRSPRPGDPASVAVARRRWLGRGFAGGLLAALGGMLDDARLPAGARVVDLGCGEGTITIGLLGGRDVEICGIDLSAAAIRIAARSSSSAMWVVANADRSLPLAAGSCDLALSLFARRGGPEIHRVLRPEGRLLVAVPAEDDLIELRELVQGGGLRLDRVGPAIEALGSGFSLVDRRRWRGRALHDAAALADLAAMTYRGARRRESERLAAIRELEVTLGADLLLFSRV